VNNDQPLHHKNVMAVVHPLSKISSNAILHCYLHFAQSGLLKVTRLQERESCVTECCLCYDITVT